MRLDSPDFRDLVASLFTDEPLDHATLARIHAGAVDYWAETLDRSGLFGREIAQAAQHYWREHPRALVETLLIRADDITRHQWLTVWDTDFPARLIS
ncbi:hypothetical protein ACFYTQ_19035 [Nocardia sp. NPDC004068]|uniref:hypothetical protein n=1 Tax=Nocardia sp. NPDC004068 TaxID=3364303 RepID=UPI0036B3F57C